MTSEVPPSKHEMIEHYQRQEDDEIRMYGHPLGRSRHIRRLEVVRGALARRLRASDVVLDIGCGDGYAANQVLGSAFAGTYVGMDLSEAKLHKVLNRRLGHRAAAVVGDAERLALLDQSVDLVICLQTMEHLIAPLVALLEMRRVLRPGGICVVSTPVGHSATDRRETMDCGAPGFEPQFQEHVQHYTSAGFADMCTHAGFRILETHHLAFSLPLYNRLACRLPYRLFALIDKLLSAIPIDLWVFRGLHRGHLTGIGRQNIMVVMQRPPLRPEVAIQVD